MARAPRVDVGDLAYHVINRANGRLQIFNNAIGNFRINRVALLQ